MAVEAGRAGEEVVAGPRTRRWSLPGEFKRILPSCRCLCACVHVECVACTSRVRACVRACVRARMYVPYRGKDCHVIEEAICMRQQCAP